jgi:hypothetical protein
MANALATVDPFKPPMARHVYYSHMTQDDLEAIVAYPRTLPPLE